MRYHSFIVLSDGTVFACGEGGDGQLGLGNLTSPKRPAVVPFFRGRITRRVVRGGRRPATHPIFGKSHH